MSFVHGASGYSTGCRCSACKEGKNAVNRIYDKVRRRSANYVRHYHPGVYDKFMDEEYAREGIERNPIGAPNRSGFGLEVVDEYGRRITKKG